MLCVQQNVSKYLDIFKRKHDYSTSFSIFKNNQDSVFKKKRGKNPQTNHYMLTSILTYDKPKILFKWQSIFPSRYVGVMGCLVFSEQSSCNYLQIKEILALSGVRTEFFSLYQRAQVVTLSCAKKRKL